MTEEQLKEKAIISNLEEATEIIIKLHKELDKLKVRNKKAENVVTSVLHTPTYCTGEQLRKLFMVAREYAQLYNL